MLRVHRPIMESHFFRRVWTLWSFQRTSPKTVAQPRSTADVNNSSRPERKTIRVLMKKRKKEDLRIKQVPISSRTSSSDLRRCQRQVSTAVFEFQEFVLERAGPSSWPAVSLKNFFNKTKRKSGRGRKSIERVFFFGSPCRAMAIKQPQIMQSMTNIVLFFGTWWL